MDVDGDPVDQPPEQGIAGSEVTVGIDRARRGAARVADRRGLSVRLRHGGSFGASHTPDRESHDRRAGRGERPDDNDGDVPPSTRPNRRTRVAGRGPASTALMAAARPPRDDHVSTEHSCEQREQDDRPGEQPANLSAMGNADHEPADELVDRRVVQSMNVLLSPLKVNRPSVLATIRWSTTVCNVVLWYAAMSPT